MEIKVDALEAAEDAENAEASTDNKTNQAKKKTMKRKKQRTRGSMMENQRKRKWRLKKIDASVETFFLQGLKFIYVFIDRSILFFSAVLYNFFFSILFGIFEFLTKIESLVWCDWRRLSL